MPCRRLGWSMGFVSLLLLAPGCAPEESRPRAVILAVGDGMGISQITLARDLRPGGVRFSFESLPVVGLVTTWSASNAVTDSAAAATALASGVKTHNRVLGLDTRLEPVTTLSDMARAHGWRVAYVTNTSVTHATPAAFYAQVENRYLYPDAIAEQFMEEKPDLALGGGWRYFLPPHELGDRQDDRNLLEEARADGYTVVRDLADLGDEPPARLLGFFTSNHLPYALDRERLPPEVRPPSLEEITALALEILGRDERPFFLLLEGGRIDQAAHGFDAAGVGAEMEAFDRALERVWEFRKTRPDTLVVLTGDHATAGLAINDTVDWDAIRAQKRSVSWMTSRVRAEEDWATPEDLAEMSGYDGFTAEHILEIRDTGTDYDAERVLGAILAEHQKVSWIPVDRVSPDTYGHTGEDVPLWAVGPGAERFHGPLDNTDIPRLIADLLGWELPAPGRQWEAWPVPAPE